MDNFLDVIDQNEKHTAALAKPHLHSLLEDHVANVNYLLPPPTLPALDSRHQLSDRHFDSNKSVWEAILNERLRSEMNVSLESFFLFEWFPRSPGLYWTHHGRCARAEAKHNIQSIVDGIVVYNPRGKMSMLDGGVGTIRLKPIRINNADYYLMSASSSGVCPMYGTKIE